MIDALLTLQYNPNIHLQYNEFCPYLQIAHIDFSYMSIYFPFFLPDNRNHVFLTSLSATVSWIIDQNYLINKDMQFMCTYKEGANFLAIST